MQQLTKRRRRGTADRDDTTTRSSELPNTSDILNAVQQGTNDLPFSQHWTLLQPSFLPPMQPTMAPPPTNMSIHWMMQKVPRGFYSSHTSSYYSSTFNAVNPQPPRYICTWVLLSTQIVVDGPSFGFTIHKLFLGYIFKFHVKVKTIYSVFTLLSVLLFLSLNLQNEFA